jgi:branched-chain amino acid transport system permease protein
MSASASPAPSLPAARPLARRPTAVLAGGLALAALVAVPFLADEFWLRLATKILIFGLAALAVDLLLGYAGLVSFGHAAYLGIGAYVAGILTQAGHESAFLVWPLASLAAAVAALVFGALSLRSTGLYFIMITLAFAQMVFYGLQSLRAYGGDDGFAMTRNSFGGLVDPYDGPAFYFIVLAIVLAVLVACKIVVRSEFGAVLRGARDNVLRLHAIGVPSFPSRLVAFVASGAITGLAGAMLANLNGYIVPSLASWQVSGELLVIVLLGGAGTLVGALVGAAALLGLSELLSELTPHWSFYLGLLIVLRTLALREGIVAMLGLGRRQDG